MRVVTVDDPVEQAWSASFLARLPSTAQEQLKATAHEEELFAGQNVYRELREPRFSFLALVISGLLRSYVTSPHGAPTGVEVVRQGSMLRLDPMALERLGRTNVQVAWTVAEELADRLVVAAGVRVPNVFGSVKVRVAWHLLELASEVNGRFVARVTQQELADSVGSVREVVARVLLSMSHDGLIVREGPVVVIEDVERLRILSQSFDE
jgi:CRP/FNR family cyclic AMP-dependent transcriptional regulator